MFIHILLNEKGNMARSIIEAKETAGTADGRNRTACGQATGLEAGRVIKKIDLEEISYQLRFDQFNIKK